ncbi:type II toxin-antitoxin system RelE/ParE family toxin [bacterium]|nr:type II toxin-antitoxin system RelE/ParE family toxin [bacterium]
MKFRVFIVADAEEDLFEIYTSIAASDSKNMANHVLEKLEAVCQSLSELAHRGHVPPELERISVHDFKEIHYKPYRILYQIIESDVFVHCVLDGRRDLQDILQERLLR